MPLYLIELKPAEATRESVGDLIEKVVSAVGSGDGELIETQVTSDHRIVFVTAGLPVQTSSCTTFDLRSRATFDLRTPADASPATRQAASPAFWPATRRRAAAPQRFVACIPAP